MINYTRKITMCLLLLCLFQISCKKSAPIKENVIIRKESSIDSIRVYYYNYTFERISAINCDDIIHRGEKPSYKRITLKEHPWYPIDFSGVIDTLIVDCKPLLLIEDQLKELKAQKEQRYGDMRMAALVYFKDSTFSQVCITETNFSNIYLDGILQEKNNHLLYLLRYYCGYYSWFSRKTLSFREELQDTTFVRDTIFITYENNPRVR